MPRKLALIIGNTEYHDPRLSKLASPEADVQGFADLLRSDQLGQFDEVTSRINIGAEEARKEIERLFTFDKRPDDLLLFYFSGHGVLDDTSELHFACTNTEMPFLHSTAVSRTFLRTAMDRSRSRRQVVILDCCNSGAFGQGAKMALGSSVGTQRLVADAPMFEPGEGWITLTASDESEVAWEGGNVLGQAEASIFTKVLLEGLRTGEADIDHDGWIAVDELYRYIVQQVAQRSKQRPRKYDNVQGQFYIAKRPPGTEGPVDLDPRIAEDLQSERISTRLDAVRELGLWLYSRHVGRVMRAGTELTRISKEDDSDRVKEAARQLLTHAPTEEELEQLAGARLVASGEPPRRPATQEPAAAPAAETGGQATTAPPAQTAQQRQAAELFDAGRRAYEAAQWDQAIGHLRSVLRLTPEDQMAAQWLAAAEKARAAAELHARQTAPTPPAPTPPAGAPPAAPPPRPRSRAGCAVAAALGAAGLVAVVLVVVIAALGARHGPPQPSPSGDTVTSEPAGPSFRQGSTQGSCGLGVCVEHATFQNVGGAGGSGTAVFSVTPVGSGEVLATCQAPIPGTPAGDTTSDVSCTARSAALSAYLSSHTGSQTQFNVEVIDVTRCGC